MFDGIQHIDQILFLFLNSLHNDFWDKAMMIFTSKEIWVPVYLMILYLIIKHYKKNAVLIIALLLVMIVISDQFSTFIKFTVERFRPTHDPNIGDLVHWVYNQGGQYGFFSSHASNTFSLAIMSSLLFKNRSYTIFIVAWSVIVSYTRIYLGLHYPLDIITGWIWGALLGFGIYKAILWIEKRFLYNFLPKIQETGLPASDAGKIILFVIIFAATILVTINRLNYYQFFTG